jgi:TonB family protein
MSFSSIAVQWREKEAKNLRTFILYSLIASGILHAGVLALNIGRFLLTKVPDAEIVPIELEIIETPKIEVAKQPEKQLAKSQSSEGGGGASGGGGGGNSTPIEAVRIQSKSSQSKQQVAKIEQFVSKQKPIPVAAVQQDKAQQKPIPVATRSKPDVIATEVTTPDKSIVTSTKPQSTPSEATEPKPTAIPLPNPQSTPISEPNSTAFTRSLSNNKLRELLAQGRANITTHESSNPNPASGNSINGSGNGTTAGIGNNNLISTGNGNGLGTGNGTGLGTGRGNGLGTGNGTGVGTGNGTGVGTGNGTGLGAGSGRGLGTGNGNGTGSNTGNGTDRKIPEKPKVIVTPKPPNENTGSKLNPADCQECIITYPEGAKRRGIEGNPEVSIDYDDNGRVTNVRLSRSSGNDELDEALVSQARNFKLKPSAGGKQGVRVGANYAIANSQRHRELQERKKRREQRRQQEVEAKREIANPNQEKPTTIPKNAIITDVTPESNQRRPEDKPETVRNRRRESENQQVEPKKPSRRNENNSNESEKVKPTKKSSSQRLQEILRRPTESPQPAPSTPVSEPVQTPDESKEN